LRQEALGGGDSTQPFQKFALRQPPLTHVSAKTPAGAASTLEIRVNDLLWLEVPSFFRAGPGDRVYTVRATEEGGTIVQFGDGKNGARVPTGQENIRAEYRKGMGAGGLVDAGQLTLLQSRPLGVRSVVNPVAAAGMADRETLDEARGNAPLTVLTLDRIVSLRDYGDFARAFSGVAKAQATLAWSGAGRRVFVTVAGPDGAAIEETGELYANLLGAMRAAGDPQVPLRVKTFTPAFFTLAGTIFCAPDRLEAKVFAEVKKALRDAFSFSAREFSQAVARSEVVATIHSVPGVVAVDLDVFHRVDKPATLETALTAAPPRTGATDDLGAELMLLDARPLALTVIKASA
jgi:predicted phage baseplate assembly protein